MRDATTARNCHRLIPFLIPPPGKNDGSVKGVHYFACKPKHGSFMRPSSVRFADLRAHTPRGKRRVKKKKNSGVKIAQSRIIGAKMSRASKKGARAAVSITPDDIGKHVWCKGGSKGVVRFVGSTEFSTGVWVGVEFNQPIGAWRHDRA